MPQASLSGRSIATSISEAPGATYRLVNRLAATLLVLALAIVVARACWFPSECPFAKVLGRPCVACGVTRDVLLMARGCRPAHNPCTILYLAWFVFEVCFRTAGAFLTHPRFFAAVDAALHAVWLFIWLLLILPFVR